MSIFGDIVPRCCLRRKAEIWKWYRYWGHFHELPEQECLMCGLPAYVRYDKKYKGLIGFCTRCDSMWRES
jgi:hypothetical protein